MFTRVMVTCRGCPKQLHRDSKQLARRCADYKYNSPSSRLTVVGWVGKHRTSPCALQKASRGTMATLHLCFYGANSPELATVRFCHPLLVSPRFTIRGQTVVGLKVDGTFTWSAGVKGLTVLLLKAAVTARQDTSNIAPIAIVGRRGSYAASLDYALSKMPLWIVDMFGVDPHGSALARRLFHRENPEMKRPGPVSVLPHRSLITKGAITVEWDGAVVERSEDLERITSHILAHERVRKLSDDAVRSAHSEVPLYKVT